jgi:hypothetical protein
MRGNGNEERPENSDSVSVSVSSLFGGREREAGLAERLNMRIVSRPSFSAKWTFFGVVCGDVQMSPFGVEGAERARG